ncbi:hypothetical protein B0I35DRAFT_36108 [Stachybotrys elegans]|uniref:Uncharacterized protein n=1 Tax=Stachybotrys elegans TaxID=80388 RepID=A0A8K0T845_9HYPO|nr:hypothetical protein B0I35DRAFT_36108 [Stachybotrys elegans]
MVTSRLEGIKPCRVLETNSHYALFGPRVGVPASCNPMSCWLSRAVVWCGRNITLSAQRGCKRPPAAIPSKDAVTQAAFYVGQLLSMAVNLRHRRSQYPTVKLFWSWLKATTTAPSTDGSWRHDADVSRPWRTRRPPVRSMKRPVLSIHYLASRAVIVTLVRGPCWPPICTSQVISSVRNASQKGLHGAVFKPHIHAKRGCTTHPLHLIPLDAAAGRSCNGHTKICSTQSAVCLV